MKKKGRLRGIELLERGYSTNNNWSIGKLYIELSSLMRTVNELCITDADIDTRKSKLNQLIGDEREILQKLIVSSEDEKPLVIIKTEDKEDFHEGDSIPQTPIEQEIAKTPNTRSSSKRLAKAAPRIGHMEEKPSHNININVQCTEGSDLPGSTTDTGEASTPAGELQGEIIIPALPGVSSIGLLSPGSTAHDSIVRKVSSDMKNLMDNEPEHNEDVELTNSLDDEDEHFVDDENDVDYTMDDEDAALSDTDAPKEPKVKKRKIEKTIKTESDRNKILKQCQECSDQVVYIRRHMKGHITGQINICDICQLSFKTRYILQTHIEKNHIDLNCQTNQKLEKLDRYECEICKRSYLVEAYLVVHRKYCQDMQCNFCPATFKKFKHWKHHEEAHTRTCSVCNEIFDTIIDLTNHLNEVHPNDKTMTCFKCNKSYATIVDLARHGETHVHDEDGIQCNICRRFFKLKESLFDHLKIHTGEKPHSCIKCSKSFTRRSDLVKHLKDVHHEEKEEFCSGCGEIFPNKSAFLIHSRDSTTPKKCPQCCLEFENCRLLRHHIPKHLTTDERKVFVCQYCGISYTNRDQLKSHINTHTGQKPFKCSVCPSAFTSRSALQKHTKCHENQRAFQCEVCSKMFNLHADLNRHKRIHTSQKDWKCDVCNKSFNQAGNLKVHQRIHSGEKPYKCNVCGQEFMYKGMYNDHLKKHESETEVILNNVVKSEKMAAILQN